MNAGSVEVYQPYVSCLLLFEGGLKRSALLYLSYNYYEMCLPVMYQFFVRFDLYHYF